MITIENIFSEYPRINQDTLPKALKKDEFEFIRENIDLYNEDETIKKYIDTFIDKLNKLAKKPEKSTKPMSEEKDDKPKTLSASDIPAIVKKFMPKFQQQAIIGSEEHFEIIKRLEAEIKAIPKDTREADKAYEKAKKSNKVNYMDFYTVYAHFFHGGSDWYVLSWDGGEIIFCYVILNQDTQMSEMGDVALSELHENNIELDFFWEVKSLAAALYAAYPD
jgi:regulator of replication initiation timing